MLNTVIKKLESEIPMQSGKTTLTKRIFGFMMLLSGLLSSSSLHAQNCSGNKVWACRYDACGFQECKCVNASQVQNWMATIPNCNFPHNTHWADGFRIGQKELGTGSEILLNAYPNPVSSSTTISFSLAQTQNILLSVFDLNGRLVSTLADASFEEGDYEMIWNAADMNAGIYFLHFQSAENSEMLKLSVTK